MKERKYLDTVSRLRTRFRKMSLKQRRRIIAVAVFVLVVVILSLEISPFGSLVEVGKPSDRTIVAPSTIQYIDEEKTEEQRDAAAAAVRDVMTYDSEVKEEALAGIGQLFENIKEAASLDVETAQKVDQINRNMGIKIDASLLQGILEMPPEQRTSLQEAVESVASAVLNEKITQEEVETARENALVLAEKASADTAVQEIAGLLTGYFLEANSEFDEEETQKAKEAARNKVVPAVTTKREGEILVKKGEIVTEHQVEVLKTIGFTSPTFSLLNLLFVGLFCLIVLGISAMYLAKARRSVFDSPGILALLGGMVVIYSIIAKLLAVAVSAWSPIWGFLMPTAAIAFITAVLLDTNVSVLIVVVCSMITGVATGGSFSISAFALLAGLFPALMVGRTSGRHELRRAGLFTSLWVAFAAFATSVVNPPRQQLLMHLGAGFLNGVVCSIVAMGLLPFLETIFRVTTNTWLLELASPEQPLLKELSRKAPGTYSHSVMVANLAETAAREVGSDSMLARVAAYYHDVGKLKRPQFFVENQPAGQNPHKQISPNLSSLIITSHVKEGVELLEENHIPPDIVDIVREHHGTSLVRYFYEEALKEGGKLPVQEHRFRYHFEKPKSKTAGILLLADSVEAAARTLRKPSASSIEQMVERIVNDKLEDGQLDECDLTFHDLNKIKKAFTKILISAYHPRIDYPKTGEGKRKLEGKNNRRNGVGKAKGKAPGEVVERNAYPNGA